MVLVRAEVSEEYIVSIKVAVTANCYLVNSFDPDEGDDTFFRNVGSYRSHTASNPR
jgi:hypothetical protein